MNTLFIIICGLILGMSRLFREGVLYKRSYRIRLVSKIKYYSEMSKTFIETSIEDTVFLNRRSRNKNPDNKNICLAEIKRQKKNGIIKRHKKNLKPIQGEILGIKGYIKFISEKQECCGDKLWKGVCLNALFYVFTPGMLLLKLNGDVSIGITDLLICMSVLTSIYLGVWWVVERFFPEMKKRDRIVVEISNMKQSSAIALIFISLFDSSVMESIIVSIIVVDQIITSVIALFLLAFDKIDNHATIEEACTPKKAAAREKRKALKKALINPYTITVCVHFGLKALGMENYPDIIQALLIWCYGSYKFFSIALLSSFICALLKCSIDKGISQFFWPKGLIFFAVGIKLVCIPIVLLPVCCLLIYTLGLPAIVAVALIIYLTSPCSTSTVASVVKYDGNVDLYLKILLIEHILCVATMSALASLATKCFM